MSEALGFPWGTTYDDPPDWQIDPNGLPPPERADANDTEVSDRVAVRLAQLCAQLLDPAGLHTIPTPTPLVAGWLDTNSIAWLAGKPGHGKTFLAIDIACSVAL